MGELGFEPADDGKAKAPAKRWNLPALAVEQLTNDRVDIANCGRC
jgi:hypothetical protein